MADFGDSVEVNNNTVSKRKTVVGSPLWTAPEIIQENSYDGKVGWFVYRFVCFLY